MSIETVGTGPLIIIFVMALVTLVTRWGGVWIMSFVPFNNRIKAFIQGMSGSVLVAILAPGCPHRRQRRSDGIIDHGRRDAGF
ncbi:AzlD family protein [Citrobacter koseri]|uniref:AzlD family protein n=1 Tax=Citrobacter koseri TaxID=545 RepID=UPI003989E808